MVRVGVLRAGYAGLGIAFASFAGGVYVPALVVPGLLVALIAAFLFAFSQDDLPKWAGIALLAYFGLTILVFLASSPMTINKGGKFYWNSAPLPIAQEAFGWLTLAAPLMITGTAILASWEREVAPRVLLVGALSGFVVVGALSVVLVPDTPDACVQDANSEACVAASRQAASQTEQQGALLRTLSAVSAVAGAAGAFWAAGRPDEYA